MTQEAMIPKMKRLDKRQRKIKIPVINIALILFSILMLIASTFINISLRHYIIPTDLFTNKSLTGEDFVYCFNIIPQIPVLMFILSVLGKRMTVTSIILYILCGLTIAPIFALGGGIRYLAEFGLGYILGYIPAVVIAGNILKKSYSFPNMTKASVLGVLTIHMLGIIYMIFIALIKHAGVPFVTGWIGAQSGLKIIYDIVISFVLILIGKYIHEFIKFISD